MVAIMGELGWSARQEGVQTSRVRRVDVGVFEAGAGRVDRGAVPAIGGSQAFKTKNSQSHLKIFSSKSFI